MNLHESDTVGGFTKNDDGSVLLCADLQTASIGGQDLSPSNWTGLVDLEDETVHSGDACKPDAATSLSFFVIK